MAPQDTAATKKPRSHSLEARRPEIIEDLTYYLASPLEKIPQTELAEKYKISADDIQNFQRRNKARIDTLRDELILGEWKNIEAHYKMLAFRAIERAKEAMPKASAKDAAIISQIAVDKVLLLENKGVARVSVLHEHRHNVDSVLELLAREMKARGISQPGELTAQVKALPPADEVPESTVEP